LGHVTGLWGERRAAKALAHAHTNPRVISPQNRTRMTQSPCRALSRPACFRSCNVLIENGILKRHIQNAMNARLMGVKPAGNGRAREFMD